MRLSQSSHFRCLARSGSCAVKTSLLAVCLFSLVGCGEPQVADAPVNSTLITNARIIDGSGQPAYSGALRFRGELITEIGMLQPLPGETVIDAGGLTLTPGFIDTHSHHDRGLTPIKMPFQYSHRASLRQFSVRTEDTVTLLPISMRPMSDPLLQLTWPLM